MFGKLNMTKLKAIELSELVIDAYWHILNSEYEWR